MYQSPAELRAAIALYRKTARRLAALGDTANRRIVVRLAMQIRARLASRLAYERAQYVAKVKANVIPFHASYLADARAFIAEGNRAAAAHMLAAAADARRTIARVSRPY